MSHVLDPIFKKSYYQTYQNSAPALKKRGGLSNYEASWTLSRYDVKDMRNQETH